MPDWSRRRALHALGATAAAALAGCNAQTSDSGAFDEPPGRQRGEPVTDYELRKVRAFDLEPLFWRGERGTENEPRPAGHLFVGSEGDLEDLMFADADPAAALASFVRGTDFESESVLVHERPVRECYDIRLRGVWREEDGVQTSFCSTLRPADVACSRDAQQTVALAIRLPFPGDGLSSQGSQWSSDCDRQPAPVTADEGGDDA